MAILVIAEHDNSQIKSGTLNTVTAAQKLGSDVHLLVAGAGCAATSVTTRRRSAGQPRLPGWSVGGP